MNVFNKLFHTGTNDLSINKVNGLDRVLQMDSEKGVEDSAQVDTFWTLTNKPVDATLEEASEASAKNKGVTLEQASHYKIGVTVKGDNGEDKHGEVTLTQRPKTYLPDSEVADQFARFSAHEAPQTDTEVLADRLRNDVGLHDNSFNYILKVDHTFLGDRKLSSESVSAFSAARNLEYGNELAIIHSPLSDVVHKALTQDDSDVLAKSQITYVSSPSDLDGYNFR